MSFTVTDESVAAMFSTSAQMEEIMASIDAAIRELKSTYESTSGGLGAHSDSIGALIEEVEAIGNEGNNAIKILVLKLTKAALIRQSHIETNRYHR